MRHVLRLSRRRSGCCDRRPQWTMQTAMPSRTTGRRYRRKFRADEVLRGYERDADLNGARMMASAGYDPIGLPTFFEKLAAKSGGANEPKGLALWLSSHPASGSRAQYVSQDIQ